MEPEARAVAGPSGLRPKLLPVEHVYDLTIDTDTTLTYQQRLYGASTKR